MTYPHPLFFYTRLTRTPPPSYRKHPPLESRKVVMKINICGTMRLLSLRNYMLDFAKIGISDTYTCL